MLKDRLPLVTAICMAILLVVSVAAVVIFQNSVFQAKNSEVANKITSVRKQVEDIRAIKDINGFTPEEVVRTFLSEVKSDNTVNAKLYLAASVQNMDIKNTLKLGSDLSNVTIGESEVVADGEDMDVSMNVQVGEDLYGRQFLLVKEDEAWKIKGISAL